MGTTVAVLAVFAAIAAGTAVAVVIDRPVPAGAFGALVGAATLFAVPFVARLVGRRLLVDAHDRTHESDRERVASDRTRDGGDGESGTEIRYGDRESSVATPPK